MARPPFVLIAALALVAVASAQQPASPPRPPASPPPSQQPQPTAPAVSYDVDVTLVEVDAVVTDANGRVIKDLRADEFQVFEDGTPQTIDRVSFVEIPIERGQPRAPELARPVDDVQTNLNRFDGRLYVLLLDDLHTATSRASKVKAAARRFIEENVGPGDVAAVVHLGPAGVGQGFTSDPRLLLESVDRFSGRKLRSETLNLIDKYNEEALLRSGTSRPVPPPDPTQIRDPDEQLRADDARVAFDQITRIARQVGPVRGRRKALIWFGEGISYDVFGTSGRRYDSLVLESFRRAVAAAGRANLVIYGVDARGLEGMSQEAMQIGTVPDPTTTMDPSRLTRELARSQDNLRQVAHDTGGFAVVNTDEFASAFDRVVEENSAYYLLGYYPKQSKSEGAYRSLDVRVTRPGASVRARRGYTLSRASADGSISGMPGLPVPMRDALASPLPKSELAMAMHAAAFRGSDGKASVLVTVEYAAAGFEARMLAGGTDDQLMASVVAIDSSGTVQASDHATVDLRVKPETERAMASLGFRTHARLALAPGRYQVRAAGLITGSGLSGSVYRDLEVPDFAAGGLQMSGLELTCIVAAYVPTSHVDAEMKSVLPAPPTTMRDFRNDDQVVAFVEVYEGGGVPERDVTFTTTVRRADGAVVVRQRETQTRADLSQSKGRCSAQVPLRELAPGDYVLRVEAETASARPVGHDVAFRVWALDSASADAAPAGGAAASGSAAPGAVPIVPVVHGAISDVPAPREVVARSNEQWQALWGLLRLPRAAPEVAFDGTMVVAVFLGERPTAGFEPEIVGARLDGDTLVIEWLERMPADAGNPPSVTTPFAVVGVPMHDGPVRFEKRAGSQE